MAGTSGATNRTLTQTTAKRKEMQQGETRIHQLTSDTHPQASRWILVVLSLLLLLLLLVAFLSLILSLLLLVVIIVVVVV